MGKERMTLIEEKKQDQLCCLYENVWEEELKEEQEEEAEEDQGQLCCLRDNVWEEGLKVEQEEAEPKLKQIEEMFEEWYCCLHEIE